jgi:cytochrome c2
MRSAAARAVVAVAVVMLAACREGGVTPRARVPGGDAAQGKILIAGFGCGGCHVIPGVPGATGRVGPSLGDLAERAYIAGSLPNAPEQLVRWIRDPQALRPGTAMPTLGVRETDARHIAAYLYSRGSGGLGPPHLIPESWLPSH